MNYTTTILFDLDGTLVNTIDLILASHAHTVREHFGNARVPARKEIIANLGRSLPDTLREYVEAMADEAAGAGETAEQMLQTYRDYQRANHDRLIRPYEGMYETLLELRRRGYTLGVVTSKMYATARMALDSYQLAELLPLGVYWEDTEKHKPDPEPLLAALHKGGLRAEETVYVGDSVHDIAAAHAAGIRVIAARWGPFDLEDLLLFKPDFVAETPRSLLDTFPGRRAV